MVTNVGLAGGRRPANSHTVGRHSKGPAPPAQGANAETGAETGAGAGGDGAAGARPTRARAGRVRMRRDGERAERAQF